MMSLMKKTGTLKMRGHAFLFVVIGLLVSESYSQSDIKKEEEVSSLKLKLELLANKYRHMCELYSNLPVSCGAPEINCTECPENWLQAGDQCFLMETDRQNWATSEKDCKDKGGHLAILTTAEQHNVVEKEGRRIGGTYTYYWIGLTDAETEGTWKWVDNSNLTNPFWNTLTSEPDNNVSGGEEGEDCAVVDSHNKRWSDVPCSFSYPRICQKAAIPLV